MKILILVMHYDDEILSCGGFIYQNSKKHNIDVVAVTDKYDWSGKFVQVCGELGAYRAIPLMIPLWTNKKTKEFNSFSLMTLKGRLSNYNIKFSDYDLVLTHGEDGDIDFHRHHKYLFRLLPNIENYGHFVAFPRKGVKNTHPLYSWIKEREHWFDEVMGGSIPKELLEKSNFVCRLAPKTVKIKQRLFWIYFPRQTNYVAINYPVELFYIGNEKLREGL